MKADNVKLKNTHAHEPVEDLLASSERPRAGGAIRAAFRPWTLAALALAISAVVFGPRLRQHLPDVSQREEYRLTVRDIRVNALPSWVPPDLIEQVIEKAGLPETASLLDDKLTEKIAAAFAAHPWVEKVVRVAKTVPARVDVELIYRVPVAMVEVKQGLYPIDSRGILLPPDEFSLADTQRYPLIVNVRSMPEGPAGTNWGDVTVLGGARLAALLTAHWKEFNLASIECPTRTKADATIDEGIYYLFTANGSKIIWGRAPGSGHPGELSADQKVGRMDEYVKRFGGFDQPDGPYEIDIRHWQEISRVKLAADHRAPPRR
jgi:hypothetical protein